MTRCVLITNLSGANFKSYSGTVRTFVHALLLEDFGPKDPARPRNHSQHRIRGFGVEAGATMMMMQAPSINYVFEREPSGQRIAAQLGGTALTTHGALRVIAPTCYYQNNKSAQHCDDYEPCSCVVIDLDCDSTDGRQIDFEHFEGDEQDPRFYESIWKRLHAKACDYYDRPYIPIRSMVPIATAKRATSEDLRSANAYLKINQLKEWQ